MACVHASNWVTLTSLISTLSPTHLMSHDIWQDIYNMNHSIMFRWHGWLSCLSSYSMKIKYLPIWSPIVYHETSQWYIYIYIYPNMRYIDEYLIIKYRLNKNIITTYFQLLRLYNLYVFQFYGYIDEYFNTQYQLI